jgi:hypothetical protein
VAKIQRTVAEAMDTLLAQAPGEQLVGRATGTAPRLHGEIALTERRLIVVGGRITGGVTTAVVPVADIREAIYDDARTGPSHHLLTVITRQGNVEFRFGSTARSNPEGTRWRGLIMDARRAAVTPSSTPQAAAAPNGASDLSEQLARLATLHQSGALSDEEFASAKSRLLSH